MRPIVVLTNLIISLILVELLVQELVPVGRGPV